VSGLKLIVKQIDCVRFDIDGKADRSCPVLALIVKQMDCVRFDIDSKADRSCPD